MSDVSIAGSIEPDHGGMARLDALKGNPETPLEVFARVAEGETLRTIAKSWKVPPALFSEWYMTTHAERYAAARVARAEDLAYEAYSASLEPTTSTAPAFENVPAAKLRADIALKLASRFDRDRYGESVKIEKEVNIGVDAGLVGFANDLLKHIGRRPGIRTLTVTQPDDVDDVVDDGVI